GDPRLGRDGRDLPDRALALEEGPAASGGAFLVRGPALGAQPSPPPPPPPPPLPGVVTFTVRESVRSGLLPGMSQVAVIWKPAVPTMFAGTVKLAVPWLFVTSVTVHASVVPRIALTTIERL